MNEHIYVCKVAEPMSRILLTKNTEYQKKLQRIFVLNYLGQIFTFFTDKKTCDKKTLFE